MEGGPVDPQTLKGRDPWPISGLVTFTGASGTQSVKVGLDGTFSVSLPPGRYVVSAETPRLETSLEAGTPCYLPQVVTVRAGVDSSVTVFCPVP